MSQSKRVMRQAAGGELVRVATFRVENGRIIATYDDGEYGRQLEKDGVALSSGIRSAEHRCSFSMESSG